MRVLPLIILIGFVAHGCVGSPPPPPRAPYHLLLGPYEYELTPAQEAQYAAWDGTKYKTYEAMQAAWNRLPHGKHVPRYYTLDDKHYTSIDALKAAIAALPAGSTVYLRGGCSPDTAIELPPRPISLTALRSYCGSHHIIFTWTFGPGGY